MKLQDFVAKTLVGLSNGVRDAQGSVKEKGVSIAPQYFKWGSTEGMYAAGGSDENVEMVEFDLPLYADAGEVAVHEGSSSNAGMVGRIRFRVPIVLPKAA